MAKFRKLKTIYRYLSQSSRDIESLSRGVGIGLFIGFLPLLGLQIVLALLFAGIFNANRLVASLGTLITNPITSIPLGMFSVAVGNAILPGESVGRFTDMEITWTSISGATGPLFTAYITGCLVTSVVSGVLGYFGTKLYFSIRPPATKRQ